MWIENICGKDVAEIQFKHHEIDFNDFQGVDVIMCECGEHEAEFKLIDGFNNKMNLCLKCLIQQEQEYKEEGTKYEVSLIK